jgi:hypothetical protein
VPSFCRHGRLESNCPICSKKQQSSFGPAKPARRSAEPRPAVRPGTVAGQQQQRRRAAGHRGAGQLRVRRMARAADDGYRHDLVPGIRATADAALLADELAFSVARLEQLETDPPGMYAEAAGAADREEGLWLAFLIAYLSPLEDDDPWAGIRAAHVPWATGELPKLDGVPLGPRTAHDPARGEQTPAAYRAWAERAGSQEAALVGDPSWDPARRAGRAFERLALPGFGRTPRYELLTILRHLGLVDLRPTSLQLTVDPADPPVVAAKRAFGIGEPTELRHRVSRFVHELDVPIEALDLALVNWNRPPNAPRITAGATVDADPERRALLRGALGVDAPEDVPA